jgi:hypothetical protein
MEAARQELALADAEGGEILDLWLELQPAPATPGAPDPASLVVSISAAADQLGWWAAGAPDAFAGAVGEFLVEAGAAEEELRTLGEIGANLGADAIGSWVEHDDEGGLDGGWFLPVQLRLAKALNFAPDTPVRRALADWARRSGVDTCAQLRRSVDADTQLTELTLPLPGANPEQELALAKAGFAAVGAPWFGAAIDAVYQTAASLELLLVVGLTGDGLDHVGVLVADPDPDLLGALLDAVPDSDPDALDAFHAALGRPAAGMLGCFQYPWGTTAGVYFAL